MLVNDREIPGGILAIALNRNVCNSDTNRIRKCYRVDDEDLLYTGSYIATFICSAICSFNYIIAGCLNRNIFLATHGCIGRTLDGWWSLIIDHEYLDVGSSIATSIRTNVCSCHGKM